MNDKSFRPAVANKLEHTENIKIGMTRLLFQWQRLEAAEWVIPTLNWSPPAQERY